MQGPQWYAPPEAPQPGPYQHGDDPNALLEPGGFWIRGGAHLIDIITVGIVGAVSGAFGAIVVGMLDAAGVIEPGWEDRIGKPTVGSFLFGTLASLVYHTAAEAFGGATVGKAICGLRVLTEDRRPCTLLKALGRNVAYYIDALFFGAIAWSSMSDSPTKQRLGDRWAGTIVVMARAVPASARRSPAVGILVALFLYATIEVLAVVLAML